MLFSIFFIKLFITNYIRLEIVFADDDRLCHSGDNLIIKIDRVRIAENMHSLNTHTHTYLTCGLWMNVVDMFVVAIVY